MISRTWMVNVTLEEGTSGFLGVSISYLRGMYISMTLSAIVRAQSAYTVGYIPTWCDIIIALIYVVMEEGQHNALRLLYCTNAHSDFKMGECDILSDI